MRNLIEFHTTKENFNSGLYLEDLKIQVYTIYQGTDKLKYFLYYKDELIFKGDDFRPSPMHGIESLDALNSLLGFLSLQLGDTDDEYFENYTGKQIKFSEDMVCEDLKMLVSDFENDCEDDREFHKEAVERLEKAYKKVMEFDDIPF